MYKEAVLGVIDAGVDIGSVLSHSERVLRSDPYRGLLTKHETSCMGICVPSYTRFRANGRNTQREFLVLVSSSFV